MDKLMQLIDKYLVPVYERHGWIAVAVLLAISGILAIAAVRLFGYAAVSGVLR